MGLELNDWVRLASGELGEICMVEGEIATVWTEDRLKIVRVALSVLTPLEVTPTPVPVPVPASINHKPGVFGKSVRCSFNPIFEEFLRRLAAVEIEASPVVVPVAVQSLQRNGLWSESQIEQSGIYIATWCGVAVLSEPPKDWPQIEAVWRGL